MATQHVDDTRPHVLWDHSCPPRLRILPQDTVVVKALQA